MTQSFIRKFHPNLKHICAVVFLAAGMAVLINGLVKCIGVSSANPIEDRYAELEYGEYVSFTLENVLSFKTKFNNEKKPLICAVKGSRLVDQTKSANEYVMLAAGKYRTLTADNGITPEVSNFLENGNYIGAENNERYIGRVIYDGFESDLFLDFVKNRAEKNKHGDRFFLGGSEAEITDLTVDNCSRYGIEIIDAKKEKSKWLWSLPFLAVGIALMLFAGSPFFYKPENTPEFRDYESDERSKMQDQESN